jgi:hypothetical protein
MSGKEPAQRPIIVADLMKQKAGELKREIEKIHCFAHNKNAAVDVQISGTSANVSGDFCCDELKATVGEFVRNMGGRPTDSFAAGLMALAQELGGKIERGRS